MDTLFQDVRYAVRGLRRAPAFTLVALLTLALGIGVNASIFGIVSAILFRPLPVERPGELVDIYGHSATSSSHDTHSYPNYLDYKAQTRTLTSVIGYSNFFSHLSLDGGSGLVIGEIVTDGYFQTLGIRPVIGRVFSPEESSAQSASAVAIIGHRFWQTRFAADPAVVGRTFRLNGTAYTVIGVAPASFSGMVPAVTSQMWIPVGMVDRVEPLGNQRTSGRSTGATRLEQRGRHWLWLKGRMAPDTDIGQVRAELETIARRLATAYPETNAQERVTVVPSRDVRINPDVDGTIRAAGLVLIAAVGLVLIVACANLANLTLARAASRRRELAVRLALGAARGRIIRQLFTESVVLSLAGGAVALPLAAWLAGVIVRVQPPLPIDLGLRIGPDWRVLVFTFAAALVTGVAFGLIPALHASRPSLVPALKQAGSWTDGRKRRVELRDALVVVQMAVSVVLVVIGALLTRSLGAASRVELGYDSDRIAVLSLALEMSGHDTTSARRFLDAAQSRLESTPEVRSVAMTARAPLSLNNNGFSLFIDGRQTSSSDAPFTTNGTFADERYLETLGLRLLSGRWIEPADRDEKRRVAVITQTMADRYWPSQEAVGREFRLRWGADPYRIVGVVADYKVDTPGEGRKPYIHLPLDRNATYVDIMVRTVVPAHTMVLVLERALRTVEPDLTFLNTGTLRDLADVRLFPVRAGAWLIGAFGLLALAVAAVGLYGVIAYSVSRRVRDIGIRKALGAHSRHLVGMVLREGMLLVAVGGLLGAGLATLAAQMLSSALFVPAFDLGSFAIAFGVLAVVALVANGVPARRASRIDPMVALRQE